MNSILLFLLGHLTGALGIYFNHRFILHGKLGKTFLFRKIMIAHGLHHAHAYTEDCLDYIRIPVWGWTTLLSLTYLCIYISIPYGFGLASCWFYYELMHRYIHFSGKNSEFGQHHRIHHLYPDSNFSGVHPWIDTIFNTLKK